MAARRVYFTTEEALAFVNKDNSATKSDCISEESDSDNESNHFDKCLTDESAGGGNISEIASTTPIETYESDDASEGSTAPVGDEIQHGCSSKEANILERSDFLYASSEEDGLPEIEDHSDVDLGCISESSSSSAVSTFSAQDVGTGHSRGPRPARSRDLRPSRSRGPRPSCSHGPRPARSHGSRPARSRGSRPVRSHSSRPARSRGSRPARSHGLRPAHTRGLRFGHGLGYERRQTRRSYRDVLPKSKHLFSIDRPDRGYYHIDRFCPYRVPGPHLPLGSEPITALDYFSLFFDDEILERVVIATNTYAEDKKDSKPSMYRRFKQKQLTKKEMMHYLGVLLLLGINTIRNYRQYGISRAVK